MTDRPPIDEPPRTQSTLISDRKGRSLVSVYVRADDSFQVVDERGGNRTVIIDTEKQKEQPATVQKVLA